jgi:DNA polymerase III subunit gamma/tau
MGFMADATERGAAQAPLALYRKYRPATFAEVRGQEHVTAPLRQALKSGRINHAYLFSGPRGCGKTSSARILARSLNCVNGPTPDPCGACDSCVALAPSGPGSIDVIEIDAASHGGVDDARDLRERAFYAPVSGRYKIYIIDEAHMVTSQGFNALLKLVEEPPSHLKFIFATTEPEKVIPTIRSRTHHYPFRLMPPSVMRELAEEILRSEQVAVDPAVLPLVVRAGGGSARDTLSILDQLLAGSDESGIRYDRAIALLGYTDAALIDEIVDAFAAADGAGLFRAVNRVIEGGHEPRRFASDLLDRFRDLIVVSSVPDAIGTGLIEVPPDRVEVITSQASRMGPAQLTRAAEIVNTGLDQMRGATSPRLLLELTCAQVLLPGAAHDERSVLARLERLESGAGQVSRRPASGQPATARGEDGASPRQGLPAPPTAAGPEAAQAPAGPASGPAALPASAAPVPPPAPAREAPSRPRAPSGQASAQPQGAAAPPAEATVASPGPPGTVTARVIQEGWDAVLQALMARRKVAWMVVRTATVVALDEGVLTLRFPRPGDVKGFASSGYEGLLKEVLKDRFGINVMIRPMSGGDPGPGERRRNGPGNPAAPQPSAQPQGPPSAGPQPPAAIPDAAPEATSPGPQPMPAPSPGSPAAPHSPAARLHQQASMRGDTPPAGARSPVVSAAGAPAAATPAETTPSAAVAGRGLPAAPPPVPRASSPMPQNGIGSTSDHVSFGDDVPFPADDDPYAYDGDELAGSVNMDAPGQLTGISLIQRDLGAQIIAEYEE